MKKVLVCILMTFVLGCIPIKVNLKVHNAENYQQNIKVIIKNRKGLQQRELGLGELPPNGELAGQFDVEKNGSFRVIGSIPNSAVIYKSPDITVTGKENPTSKEVTAKNQGRSLDDTKALETISRSFKNLGHDIGANPLEIRNALSTRFGAIVVAVPNEGEKTGEILYTITPNILGVKVIKLDEIDYPGSNETENTLISGSAAITVDAQYGPIGHFGISWKDTSFYEMKWVLRGFGQITKTEDPEKDPTICFNALDKKHIDQITQILKTHPHAKIYYINSMYVLKLAELFIKESKNIIGETEFNATNVVTAKGVYNTPQKLGA